MGKWKQLNSLHYDIVEATEYIKKAVGGPQMIFKCCPNFVNCCLCFQILEIIINNKKSSNLVNNHSAMLDLHHSVPALEALRLDP